MTAGPTRTDDCRAAHGRADCGLLRDGLKGLLAKSLEEGSKLLPLCPEEG